MALTIDSTIKDLLADPKAKAILDRHLPGFSTHPLVALGKKMTLKWIATIKWMAPLMREGMVTDAKIKAIEEDLEEL